jgi:hydroxymethylbilane synthase
MPRPLRVATRGSELARWQAQRVATLLGADTELVVVSTSGDRRADVPIHAVGGTGIFVKEVQQAVLDGRADLAVHSAKDLPASDNPDGLVLAATPERADPRDALVGSTLHALPAGARVATGSVRRRAQLVALRPDLTFAELRGNIATRLARAVDFDAIVVAAAALARLGLGDRADEVLEPSVLLPQVGQGALAVECRADDDDTLARVVAIDDTRVHAAIDAERAYLAELGGGCDLPCGALAHVDDDEIAVEALLASVDGHVVLRVDARAADPVAAGRAAATELMARGGASLLEDSSLLPDSSLLSDSSLLRGGAA